MLEFKDCRRLQIEGVEIANSPGWTLHLKRCDDVVVRGVSILNDLGGPNTDGIDIDGCRDVRVSDCLIQAGDDAVVLKTTPDSRSCERVTVTNCSITTRCRALKLGALESFHDMRDVVFSNCVVRESVAIFALYCRNGGTLENIAVSNIVGHAFANADHNQPIHIDSARATEESRPGRIRNVTVDNFICHSNGRVLITGEPGHPVENITLRGVMFFLRDTFDCGQPDGARKGNQFSPRTPEARAARAAFVAQHVRGLVLRDCRVDRAAAGPGAEGFEDLWARDVERLHLGGAEPFALAGRADADG